MQAPARRSTRKDRGENIRVTGALLRKAAISVFCGQRSRVVLPGVRKKGKPSFINCSKPFMMLWGGVGMFLSLLQFFATKFLVLALHLESGSFPRPLSAREETEAFSALRAGDPAAREKLIRHNLRLVAHIVKKYYALPGGHAFPPTPAGALKMRSSPQRTFRWKREPTHFAKQRKCVKMGFLGSGKRSPFSTSKGIM